MRMVTVLCTGKVLHEYLFFPRVLGVLAQLLGWLFDRRNTQFRRELSARVDM